MTFRLTSLVSLVVIVAAINMSVYFTSRPTSSLHNPTYDEVCLFLAHDDTGQHPYIAGSYECWNFANDFVKHALSHNLLASCVLVQFTTSSHMINAFFTVDNGTIFVEPQADQIVEFSYMPDNSTWLEGGIVSYYVIETVGP